VPVVWLEFDRLDVERASEPNVSTCLAPSYSNPLAPVASSGHATTLAIMSETLRVVDARATRAESNALELLVSELPANANWIHFSAMWTRRPRQLKLYGSFPESSLLGYLKTAGWAGDFELLARVLRRYCPRERTNGMLYVDLPVTGMRDAQRAALGISFSQQHLRLACERDPQWTALLTELCAARVCTRERARAVQAWLRSAPGAPGPRKWLDIKLILKPQRSLEAKAYLGVGGSLLA
jgi:hypothetical protein